MFLPIQSPVWFLRSRKFDIQSQHPCGTRYLTERHVSRKGQTSDQYHCLLFSAVDSAQDEVCSFASPPVSPSATTNLLPPVGSSGLATRRTQRL
ncbi:hypothetical protein TGRH88_018940 [Toxoplasma gondii]|uniref:Uncharacterized protein n=1 Tax=Toxoplasma gondii TaxID=5811 RepID=A0A7J6KG37_TOXGO|nr:hypothetical protein TGRH88_018940 [Toxoplasma gondii]